MLSGGFAYDYQIPAKIESEPIEVYWNDIVSICTEKYGIDDPYFIAAIIKLESDFNPNAVNQSEKTSYEVGGNQLVWAILWKRFIQLTGEWIAGVPTVSTVDWQWNMPSTAKYEDAPIMNDAYNAQENIDRGCWYLKSLLTYYSNDLYKQPVHTDTAGRMLMLVRLMLIPIPILIG